MLAEDPAKVQRVVVADDGGDLRYIIICGLQQADGVVNSDGEDVLHGRFHGDLLEIPQEPADAHATGLGVFFKVVLNCSGNRSLYTFHKPPSYLLCKLLKAMETASFRGG